MAVNYSLYLVTDSTAVVLGSKDLPTVVESAIEGGVTIVQYRDKTSETKDLILMAKRLHTITKKHHIPLLINDRVDVALAAGAEGVHIGQDDMGASLESKQLFLLSLEGCHNLLIDLILTKYTDLGTARQLMGPNAIIGVTCSSLEEAYAATTGGADYLGIGTMFATPT